MRGRVREGRGREERERERDREWERDKERQKDVNTWNTEATLRLSTYDDRIILKVPLLVTPQCSCLQLPSTDIQTMAHIHTSLPSFLLCCNIGEGMACWKAKETARVNEKTREKEMEGMRDYRRRRFLEPLDSSLCRRWFWSPTTHVHLLLQQHPWPCWSVHFCLSPLSSHDDQISLGQRTAD